MNPTISRENPIVILLVEDNPAHAELVKRSLEAQHIVHHLIHVTDGEAALDYLNRRGPFANPDISPRPRMILLDLRLPKVDGLEVIRDIKATPGLAQIPVVILTTSRAQEDVVRAYTYHVNSYLVKPTDFEKFTRLMADLSHYWLVWNYVPW